MSSISAGTVTAVSTATNSVTRIYTVSASPQRIALSAAVRRDRIDGTRDARRRDGLGDPRSTASSRAVGLALAPDGKVLYVTNPPRGKVQIVDVVTKQVITLRGLVSPRNVAFGLSGAAALVTGEGNTPYVIR